MRGGLVPAAGLGESRNAGWIGALARNLPATGFWTGVRRPGRFARRGGADRSARQTSAAREGGKLMDRHGRPPASDVEAWLAQELSFLYSVGRKILRRAALARRSRWLCAALLAAGVCCSVWALVGTMGKS